MSDAELVKRLWCFVVSDSRFGKIGLRGGVQELYQAATGSLPDDDLVKRVVKSFWLAWDEYHANTNDMGLGRGTPNYLVEGELSPWQENAIRALEDARVD